MFKKLALGLLGLLVLYLVVVASDLLPRTTAEQQQALDLLQQPPQRARGSNDAFPMLWSLRHDVPEAERAALLAADQKRYAELEASGRAIDFQSGAKKYPEAWPDSASLCPRAQEADCLAHVRANLEPIRAAVTQHAGLLARAAALRDTDHARYGFKPSLASPLPSMGIGPLQVTASALDFVEGRQNVALENACRDFASWRRLRSHTDMLVLDMVGVAFANEHMALLAGMLAELPVDHPLPESCTTALVAPDAGEFDQCDVWRGEFASITNTIVGHSSADIAMMEGRSPRFYDRLPSLVLNERATVASFAPYYGHLCSQTPAVMPEQGWVSRTFNPMGRIILETALPNVSGYQQRVHDFAAIVQGLRTLVWLRGQPDAAAAFAQRPGDLKPADRDITLDASGHRLLVPLLQPRDNTAKQWPLPLPASRLSPAPVVAAAPVN